MEKFSMKHMRAVLSLILLLCTFPLVSQEVGSDSEENIVVYKMNQEGDQHIALNLNLGIPYNPFGTLLVGGSGSIGYNRFITDNITLGGSLSFAYNQTLGSNVFYFVPLTLRVAYQFDIGAWEIPLSLDFGVAWENYIDRMYFGLAVRPEVAAYYRFNTDWSFGLHTGLYILPQWYSDPTYNAVGLIHDIGLSVRYHF